MKWYISIFADILYLLQAMYKDFSTAHIQIDKDFRATLSGYGCVGDIPENEISNKSPVSSLSKNLYNFLFGMDIYSIHPVHELFNFPYRLLETWHWRQLKEECLLQRAMYGVLEFFFWSYLLAERILIAVTLWQRGTWSSGAFLS